MTEDESTIAESWLIAARDLGLEVTSPFVLHWEDEPPREYLAWVKDFGSAKGVLFCLPDQWDEMGYARLAMRAGYFCSGLFPVYTRYDRDEFIATLNDLGWFGDPSRTPSWYTGEPWTTRSKQ